MMRVSPEKDSNEASSSSKTYIRHRVQSYVEGVDTSRENYETYIPAEDQADFVDKETVEVVEEVIEVSSITRGLIAETVLGYIWWSLIHAVGAMIWFYPLNELEISGYEAFAVVLLSPIITKISFISRFISSPVGLTVVRLCSMVGVISFQAPTTFSRLILLMFGCGNAMLWLCGSWWSTSPRERTLSFWGTILGFFAMLSLRICYVSLNPIWWSPTFNTATCIAGIVMTISQAVFISGDSCVVKTKKSIDISWHQWLRISVGFSAMFWLTHWVFGEVSLVSRWAVTGLPESGPNPNPWGIAVLIGLSFGIMLSPNDWTKSFVWWLIGSAGAAMLYRLPTHWSFVGGIILAVYLMSIWPLMADKLARCNPGSTLPLAMGLYIVLILASVWVVAFNFVPGGEFTRERTGTLMAITMLLIGTGIATNVPLLETKSKNGPKSSSKMVFLKLHGDRLLFFKTYVKIGLIFILIGGCAAMLLRCNSMKYNTPSQGDEKKFSAAVWTVHFGYDNQGWPSYERAALMLNETGADVIGLLESDCSRPYLGNNDLTMWLAERLGMYSDFGPSTRDHTWGSLILSKYPIVKSSHHLLPSPEGELAPALSASVNISGQLVDFVVVHMGNDGDDLDRKLQAQELARIMDESHNPTVFLGYVTSAPGSRDYHVLLNNGKRKDIDPSDKERWCEYIMYDGLIRQGYARISHAGLSDTEVQIAKFLIPDDPKNYSDNQRTTTVESEVPEISRFSNRFGNFFRGHYYAWQHHFHMSTPKYFL
ncbi:PGAP2-interacting protein-like [Dendronephthya gigantea]|uniref:PGAP2-interacting protein-like n=1 Tax=Dendronephthya gigantea TaxID=151771 RepID=UPI00106B98DC|nr:PGAP2-interacting protein-like [Dendronephthya gigantea]